MKQIEQEHKVKVKYPEIRDVLKVLFKSGYRSGAETSPSGDGYDHSTAYEEIEQFIQTQVIPAVIDAMLVEENKIYERMDNMNFLITKGHNQCCALQKEKGDKIIKRI